MTKTLDKHPLVQHKVSILRNKNTNNYIFRTIVKELSSLMVYEFTKDLELSIKEIQTPVSNYNAPFIDGSKLLIVPILRAGLGMVEGVQEMIPDACVGHIGLYRDEKTLQPVEFYSKLPDDADQKDAIIVDPMLATGGSAIAAIDHLQKRGIKNIKLVCLIGCPEGVHAIEQKFPELDLYVAVIDKKLNDKGYITPGLGDAGDRIFGT